MDSKKKEGQEPRKILKAARRGGRRESSNNKNETNNSRRKGHGVRANDEDRNETFSTRDRKVHATGKNKDGRERGKGKKDDKSLARSLKSKDKNASPSSSSFLSTTSVQSLSSNKKESSKKANEDILKQIMSSTETKNLKSFKIPKKKAPDRTVVGSSDRHESSKVKVAEAEMVPKSFRTVKSSSKRMSKEEFPHDNLHVGNISGDSIKSVDRMPCGPFKAESEPMECEDMDWEETVQKVQQIKGWWSGYHFQHDDLSKRKTEGMEVDVSSTTESPGVIIVADTNIWIHNLNLIKEILRTKFMSANPLIVIPWMVLQELDGGKKNNGDGAATRNAIAFIHKLLSQNDHGVKGQKASDAAQIMPGFDHTADDSILQCALQCQSANVPVILLTNDWNLKNKAIVNQVKTCDARDGMAGVHNCLQMTPNQNNNIISPFTLPPPTTSVFSSPIQLPPFTPTSFRHPIENSLRCSAKRNHSPTRCNDDDDDDCSKRSKVFSSGRTAPTEASTFDDLLKGAGETLSYVIEKKMKEDYGDPGWLDAVKIRPPWTLKDAVNCISKHWIAVFSEVFGRRNVVDKLLAHLQKYERGQNNPSFQEEIIESIHGLLLANRFASCKLFKGDERIKICEKSLKDYRNRLEEVSNLLET